MDLCTLVNANYIIHIQATGLTVPMLHHTIRLYTIRETQKLIKVRNVCIGNICQPYVACNRSTAKSIEERGRTPT